jgi:putative transposase
MPGGSRCGAVPPEPCRAAPPKETPAGGDIGFLKRATEGSGDIRSPLRLEQHAIAASFRFHDLRASDLLDEAATDGRAYMTFPPAHRSKLHSTNSLERLSGEIKRRTEVVGIFPNEAAIVCRVGAILLEQHDAWSVQGSRYLSLESVAPLSDNPLASLPILAASPIRPRRRAR